MVFPDRNITRAGTKCFLPFVIEVLTVDEFDSIRVGVSICSMIIIDHFLGFALRASMVEVLHYTCPRS